MAFLTDAFITSMLGGDTRGAAKYAAIAPDAASKLAFIQTADAVVVAAALKGGYSSVTSVPAPSSGDAFNILRAMSFGVWVKAASFYSRDIELPDSVVSTMPTPESLYAPDGIRLNLPGLERDTLGGDGAAELTSGTSTEQINEPLLTRDSLAGF